MYKFLGKKGAFYLLDLEPINIKLNYRCKEGTVEEGSFSCGNTPQEAKKNYEEQQKEKTTQRTISSDKQTTLQEKLKFYDAELAKGYRSTTLPDGTRVTNLKGKANTLRKQLESMSNTTSDTQKLVDKVKSRGKITQEEYNILKPLVDDNNNYKNINYNNLVKNSEKYIKSSKDVKNTIENYTDIEGCYLINNYLGGKIKENDSEAKNAQKEISKLDNVFKNAPDTVDNIITWRSPSKGEVKRLLSQVKSEKLEDLVGQTITRNSFTSTSRDENIVKMFHGNSDIVFEVKVPKGSKAISVESASNEDFANVKEVLLDRGQTWKIDKVSKQGKQYKVHFSVIKNGENT
jgi:hypothetical protein